MYLESVCCQMIIWHSLFTDFMQIVLFALPISVRSTTRILVFLQSVLLLFLVPFSYLLNFQQSKHCYHKQNCQSYFNIII